MKAKMKLLFWSLWLVWFVAGYLSLICSRGEAIGWADVVTAAVCPLCVIIASLGVARSARTKRGKAAGTAATPFAALAKRLLKFFAVAILLYGGLMWLVDGVLQPLPLVVLAVWALAGAGLEWCHGRWGTTSGAAQAE